MEIISHCMEIKGEESLGGLSSLDMGGYWDLFAVF